MAQTLTPCRFAAVPLGKGDNKSHFQQALCRRNNGDPRGFLGRHNKSHFNKHFVPLTKGDSREAAGGQGLSHFYHGLLGVVRSTTEQNFFGPVTMTAAQAFLKPWDCRHSHES